MQAAQRHISRMAVVTFDTLAVAKELKAAGFSDEQAEAVSRVVRRSQEVLVADLATKVDLEKAIAECKTEILKWVLGAMGLQTIAVLGALLTLVRAGGHS